jgi:hypothetical protein
MLATSDFNALAIDQRSGGNHGIASGSVFQTGASKQEMAENSAVAVSGQEVG